jgi:autotransporter-associated beta strand protein
MKSINKIYNHNAISTKLIFVLIVQLFFICSSNAQFGNITLNGSTTSKGAWTTVGTVNTFTPSANGSNVNVADIVTKLGTGDVIISTSCSVCSEAGNITISSAIASLKPAAAPVLKFLAEKTISINAAIDLGIKEGSERTDRNAPSIEFASANGNIISSTNGKISTNPANGFVAGYAKFTANNGSVQINGVVTTSSSTSGGPVSIFGNAGVTISANITTSGGTTGILKITDNNNTLSTNSDLTNQGQTGGVLTIASFENLGTGAFKLRGANVYTGNTTLTSGSLLLGADNSIPTTSSMIFNGGDFKPSGFNSTIKTIKVTANSTITFDAAQSSTITFDSLLYSSTPSTYITVNGWQGFSQTIALTKNGALSKSSTDFVTTNGTLQNVTNPGGLTQYGQILTSAVGGSGGLKGKIFASSNLSGSILASTINKIKFFNGTDNKLYQSIQISTKEIIPGTVNP